MVLNRDDVIERVESGEEKFQGKLSGGKRRDGEETRGPLTGEFGWGRMVI